MVLVSSLSTKDRMVMSAITLLREQGVPGVTVDAVLAHSGAPRGSVYHHFPGGRAELVLTAGRTAADYITQLLRDASVATEPSEMVDRFVAFWRTALEQTDYRAGCPVVALATGNRDLPEADELVRETFTSWHASLRELLVASGWATRRAEADATFIIAAIEGAVVLCKSLRSSAPLDDVAESLRLWLQTAP